MHPLFSRLEGKKVYIESNNFSGSINSYVEYKGIVVACYDDAHSDMFLELDTGEIINTRYISVISVSDNDM